MRELYITMLEKRASEPLGVDSQEAANAEHEANILDQRSEVSNLFASSEKAEKDTTKVLHKALPIAKKTEGTSGSNTMLKTAMNIAFFGGLRETGMLKVATPEYLQAAYSGFQDELDKIAKKMMPDEILHHLSKMKKRVPKVTLTPTGQKSTFQLTKHQ